MLTKHIGKIVTLFVDKSNKVTGMLSSHAPHLYQVTGGKDHFVFYDYEINGILIDGERISLIHCYYPIKG